MSPYRRSVFIVDDHAGFRASARRLLEDEGYVVVGEAENGRDGLQLARKLEPDFVLLDVMLPDVSGIETSARITELPQPPLVILTSSHDQTDVEPIMGNSGATGFVPKAHLTGAAIAEVIGR